MIQTEGKRGTVYNSVSLIFRNAIAYDDPKHKLASTTKFLCNLKLPVNCSQFNVTSS